MELLVYARNYRPWGAEADAPSRLELGAAVGERVPALGMGERLCSFVEVRLPGSVIDPNTEIELLVVKAFAAWGHPGGGRVLRFGNPRGSIALLLEPGFERARDLCRALQPVLPRARALLERAQERPIAEARAQLERAQQGSRSEPRMRRESSRRSATLGSAVPSIIVDPADERVAPLRLPVPYRFVPPRLDG
jgi:hypothetical protein